MTYFYEADRYQSALRLRKKVTYSEYFTKFKLHITEIGALDLTEPKNRNNIPTIYWQNAVICNCHIFPIDKNYIKNVLYRDKVFNLMLPYLYNKDRGSSYTDLKLTVLHEEILTNIRNTKKTSKGLEYIICALLGTLYLDHFKQLGYTNLKDLAPLYPFVQLWFNRVRTE
jgi:hypothetical protein